MYVCTCTLNSIYNKVALNEKLAITKENLCTKYFPFTCKYITLNKKPPIMKENLHIFFFIIGGVECICVYVGMGMGVEVGGIRLEKNRGE